MEPCKGGTLANLPKEAEELLRAERPSASNASWAFRFAASQKGVTRVLSGMNSMEQVEDNTETFLHFEPVTDREQEVIEQVTGITEKTTPIPCTGCSYCTHGCPKDIACLLYTSESGTSGASDSPEGNPSSGSHILIAYFSVPETDGVDTVAGASRVATGEEVLGNNQYFAQLIQH